MRFSSETRETDQHKDQQIWHDFWIFLGLNRTCLGQLFEGECATPPWDRRLRIVAYMKEVKSQLETRNVPVFMVDASTGQDFGQMTLEGLYCAKGMVAFCTSEYGAYILVWAMKRSMNSSSLTRISCPCFPSGYATSGHQHHRTTNEALAKINLCSRKASYSQKIGRWPTPEALLIRLLNLSRAWGSSEIRGSWKEMCEHAWVNAKRWWIWLEC